MLLAVAITGWVLFVAMFIYYRIALKIDVRDENALSVYALCVAFSEKFREPVVSGLRGGAVKQLESKPIDDVIYLMMKTIKHFAIENYKPDAEVNTISLAHELVKSFRPNVD